MTQPDPAAASAVGGKRRSRAPWFPLIVIVLAQLQLNMNVSVLPVSLGPISEDLAAPTTAVATALLLYSLFVAAFVMLGAKIGKLVGERRVFQASVVAHGVAMGLMATSTDASVMNTAQAIAGVAAAALVPTLVVLIAANYHGRQQATALGVLAGIPAVASAVTFVIAGFLATALSWRYSYGLIVVLAVVVFILSFRLTPIPRQPSSRIDFLGVVLSAAAIALILVGVNNLQTWGPLVADAAAPFSLLRLSPAPIFILVGIVFGQAFFAWSNRRVAANKQPLLAMEVLASREEKSAPPQIVWEFVTTPGRRMAWQLGVTGVKVTAAGNRRGVGATTHCMHGKEASLEEVLDWRPYDYYTIRNTVPTPAGPIRFLETMEFEPTPAGTVLH